MDDITKKKEELLKIVNNTKNIASDTLQTLYDQGNMLHEKLSKVEDISESLDVSEDIVSKIEKGLVRIGLKKDKNEYTLPPINNEDTQYHIQLKKNLCWFKYEIRFTKFQIVFIRKKEYSFDIDYSDIVFIQQEPDNRYISIYFKDKKIELYSLKMNGIINDFKRRCKLGDDFKKPKDNIKLNELENISNILQDIKEITLIQNEVLSKQNDIVKELNYNTDNISHRLEKVTKKITKL